MKVKDNITNSIFNSLKQNISIDVNKLLESGISFDNSPQILKAIKTLLENIAKDKIEYLYIENNTIIDKTQKDLFHCFVIALVEVDPIDFEGNEPLDIDILIKTTSEYIFENIKNQQIEGLSIKI